MPPTELLEMRDVRVSSDGLLFKGRQILPESFAAPFLLQKWKATSRLKFLANNYLLRKTRVLEDEALWILDDWSGGYYHWFVDTLPRLLAIGKRAIDLVLLLPARYTDLEFVHSSLAAFSLRRIEPVAAAEVVHCRRLVVPMHTAPSGHHNEILVRGVRQLLVARYGVNEAEGQRKGRVYISRERASKRRIRNEAEVIRTMQALDFQIVFAEELTLEEQILLCSSARYLVSNHGAGLTNMLFLGAGSSVLELRNKGDREYNCYFNLASALALNYFYQTCESVRPEEDAHTADLIVNTQRLRENLELMLSSNEAPA
jgi:capsular polysaccharide biosynthesis protein